MPAKREDLEERVRDLWRMRWSDPAIAQACRCHPRTVMRVRRRLGLQAWPWGEQLRQVWRDA